MYWLSLNERVPLVWEVVVETDETFLLDWLLQSQLDKPKWRSLFGFSEEISTFGMTEKNWPTASRHSKTKNDEIIDATWVLPPADSWHEVRDKEDVDVIVPKNAPKVFPAPIANDSCSGLFRDKIYKLHVQSWSLKIVGLKLSKPDNLAKKLRI